MKDILADESVEVKAGSVAVRVRSLPQQWRRVLLPLQDAVGLGVSLVAAALLLAAFGWSMPSEPIVAFLVFLLLGGWILLYYLNRHYDTRVSHRRKADAAGFIKTTLLAALLAALLLAFLRTAYPNLWMLPLIGGVLFVLLGFPLRRLGWMVLADPRRKLPLFVVKRSLLSCVRKVVTSQPWGPFLEPELIEAPVKNSAAAHGQGVADEFGRRDECDSGWFGVVADEGEVRLLKGQLETRTDEHALIWAFPDFIEQAARFIPAEALDKQWARVHLRPPGAPASGAKRVFDLVLGFVFFLIALPIGFLVTILIELDAPGAVFYLQRRPGLRNREFTLLKFRTMDEPPEISDSQWASVNDPRVTRAGRILRLSRLNELPQLLNVLWGNMSLVGPRPELPGFVRMLGEEIPCYNYRHLVKPGMTGWAQINFTYGASVEEARTKLEYDLYYVRHCSVWFDLYILLRSIVIVLGGKGR